MRQQADDIRARIADLENSGVYEMTEADEVELACLKKLLSSAAPHLFAVEATLPSGAKVVYSVHITREDACWVAKRAAEAVPRWVFTVIPYVEAPA